MRSSVLLQTDEAEPETATPSSKAESTDIQVTASAMGTPCDEETAESTQFIGYSTPIFGELYHV